MGKEEAFFLGGIFTLTVAAAVAAMIYLAKQKPKPHTTEVVMEEAVK